MGYLLLPNFDAGPGSQNGRRLSRDSKGRKPRSPLVDSLGRNRSPRGVRLEIALPTRIDELGTHAAFVDNDQASDVRRHLGALLQCGLKHRHWSRAGAAEITTHLFGGVEVCGR